MKIIDLTQAMTNGMPVMAGIAPPEFRDLADVATDGYAMSRYTFVNHTGTHVDAPAHQIAGGASLDDIPLNRLVTDALTIDLTGRDPGPVGPAALGGSLDQVRPGDIVLRLQAVREARDIMRQGAECIGEGDSLAAAAQKMRDLGVGSLAICGTDDRLHGILTDRDIVLRCIAEGRDPAQIRAGDLAQDMVFWVEATADVGEVLHQMEDHRVKHLPVIEGHRLVGIITEADLARSLDEHRLAKSGLRDGLTWTDPIRGDRRGRVYLRAAA